MGDDIQARSGARQDTPKIVSDTVTNSAIARGLKWLASQQQANGSWNFATGPHPGQLAECPAAATSMALIPYLHDGYTHQQGDYKKVVGNGLIYLHSCMKINHNCGSLIEPGASMYGHGLGTIALCEAYGRTKDRKLRNSAQLAVNFIVYAQDPNGGGWRYKPRQKGDTSVFGWQLTALKIAVEAGLQVPRRTFVGASKFLDHVQTNNGTAYGYTSPGAGQATTSIGLLCRMYEGWKPEHPALQQGVAKLSQYGPSRSNLYFNYYCTKLMQRCSDDFRKKWNADMRKTLLESQSNDGSWHFTSGGHCTKRGGGLYCTSMSLMILESISECGGGEKGEEKSLEAVPGPLALLPGPTRKPTFTRSRDGFNVTLPSGAVLRSEMFEIDIDAVIKWLEQTEKLNEQSLVWLFHDNGSLFALASHEHGILHGVTIALYESKAPMAHVVYQHGKKHGLSRTWNTDGFIAYWCQFCKGKRHGLCCLFEDGRLRLVLECEHNNINGIHLFSNDALYKSFTNKDEALLNNDAKAALSDLDEIETLLTKNERDFKKMVKAADMRIRRERVSELNPKKRAAIQSRMDQRADERKQLIDTLQHQSKQSPLIDSLRHRRGVYP